MTLRDVLTELGIDYAEHGDSPHVTQGWVGIICPMPGCGQGNKYGRGIHTRSFRTSCWKCGPARLTDVLVEASGRPLAEILKLLPHLTDDSLPLETRPRGKYTPPAGVEPLLEPHKRYLRGRGFDPDVLASVWGIGALGAACAMPWRLFIPVRMNGEELSWTTRTIGKAAPRYRAALPSQEAVPIHNLLYGWDFVRHSVVVVEGPADAWAVGPGAVCTFGVGVTPIQTALLSTIPRRIVLFDADDGGRRREEQLADALAPFPGETFLLHLQTGKDPATSSQEEIEEIRSFAFSDLPFRPLPASIGV